MAAPAVPASLFLFHLLDGTTPPPGCMVECLMQLMSMLPSLPVHRLAHQSSWGHGVLWSWISRSGFPQHPLPFPPCVALWNFTSHVQCLAVEAQLHVVSVSNWASLLLQMPMEAPQYIMCEIKATWIKKVDYKLKGTRKPENVFRYAPSSQQKEMQLALLLNRQGFFKITEQVRIHIARIL